MNNFIHRLYRRLHLLRLCYIPRDVPFQSLLQKLQASGFDFLRFERAINYRPRNWKYFFQALIHRSYLPFIETNWNSNERLEFLGDSVLNSLVAEFLFKMFPEMEEGNLTKLRSRLVNRKILALRAREMGLSSYLLLSTSAAQSIDSGSESILADAFESIVGAIFLDGGIKAARKFIGTVIVNNQEVLSSALTDDNYKSTLLEYAQGHALGIPRYSVLKEEGPEHDRRFTVEVVFASESWGVGSGRSKKEAEQAAAAKAIERIQQPSHTKQTEDQYVAPSK